MSETERVPYAKLALEDRKRYEIEFELFKSNENFHKTNKIMTLKVSSEKEESSRTLMKSMTPRKSRAAHLYFIKEHFRTTLDEIKEKVPKSSGANVIQLLT
jgi:hypothetical protein